MKVYNWLTYRAVIIAWLQMVFGRMVNGPRRLYTIWQFRTGRIKPMEPDEFKRRTDAAIARLEARNTAVLKARQRFADEQSARIKEAQKFVVVKNEEET